MPKRPKPIKELIITPIFGGLIAIEIASKRAFDWMEKEANNFGLYEILRENNSSYVTARLMVSSCFDVNEVIEYLLSPNYVENNVLNIVGEEKGGGE